MSEVVVHERLVRAPRPSWRLIPSRFPPVGLFDTVATAADLEAVMELAGWTNDRLVAERIARLPRAEWVFGAANSSIVMAAFLHAAPGGLRFNGPDLGAWYACASLKGAVAEVGHHLRREAAAAGVTSLVRHYRTYTASLFGRYLDLRGQQAARPDVYASDDYAAGQVLGEGIRAAGGAGVVYDSVRLKGCVNITAHRPRNVRDVVQAEHFEITARVDARRIDARRLAG